MFKKMVIALVALVTFMVTPAFAGEGCNEFKFVGSYTRAETLDLFLDGSVIHTFIYQLNIHSDGTADQYWTGFLAYPLNTGSGSSWIGSWKCQNNGKLLVTFIRARYVPTTPTTTLPPAPNPDIQLLDHIRNTYLFSVPDNNTLNRVQGRARRYTPTQDPTDPNGGTLFALDPTVYVYKRLKASAADLLAP